MAMEPGNRAISSREKKVQRVCTALGVQRGREEHNMLANELSLGRYHEGEPGGLLKSVGMRCAQGDALCSGRQFKAAHARRKQMKTLGPGSLAHRLGTPNSLGTTPTQSRDFLILPGPTVVDWADRTLHNT